MILGGSCVCAVKAIFKSDAVEAHRGAPVARHVDVPRDLDQPRDVIAV
jgi:hypothetical protein